MQVAQHTSHTHTYTQVAVKCHVPYESQDENENLKRRPRRRSFVNLHGSVSLSSCLAPNRRQSQCPNSLTMPFLSPLLHLPTYLPTCTYPCAPAIRPSHNMEQPILCWDLVLLRSSVHGRRMRYRQLQIRAHESPGLWIRSRRLVLGIRQTEVQEDMSGDGRCLLDGDFGLSIVWVSVRCRVADATVQRRQRTRKSTSEHLK
mmetsp:Transcript_9138/g.24661  ORF Transcript_9138/g.24661 Transcript_9138/m.24661 type:complete len:202 (+) Transcript_9138:24-629(+)